MSERMKITSAVHDYSVAFEEDYARAFAGLYEPGDIVLIDERVLHLYGGQWETLLAGKKHLAVPVSEEKKDYLALADIVQFLIENGFTKSQKLFAVGGGIVQDITAFSASILFRGVPWIFFPTTLLAQCDSCIGGKTSINFKGYKNQIGNFYPPSEIVINPGFLETLPDKDIRSGYGEMMHFYILSGPEDFQKIRTEIVPSRSDPKIREGLIRRCLAIKKTYVEMDEFDRKERQVLNYGHSFGHALESLTHYDVPHGIAVSYGMDLANFLSWKLGYLGEDERMAIRDVLKSVWEPGEIPQLSVEPFLEKLKKDKKNVGTEIRVILTRGIGRMFKTKLDLDPRTIGWIEEYFRNEIER